MSDAIVQIEFGAETSSIQAGVKQVADRKHFTRELQQVERLYAGLETAAVFVVAHLATAHRLSCEEWNARPFIGGDAAPSPTIADVIPVGRNEEIATAAHDNPLNIGGNSRQDPAVGLKHWIRKNLLLQISESSSFDELFLNELVPA